MVRTTVRIQQVNVQCPTRRKAQIRYIVAFALALAFSVLASSGASFTATLDRSTIGVGETAQLSLVFENAQPQNQPVIPNVPGLVIRYENAGRTDLDNNGRRSFTITFVYSVVASKEGDYTIPVIAATVNGRAVQSEPLSLKVQKMNLAENGGPFLKLVAPRNEFYVGETFVLEVQLYAQQGNLVAGPSINAEGFTLGQIVNGGQTQTRINGRGYGVVTFKAVLTAVKPGAVSLGPATIPLQIPGAVRRDPMDPFGMFAQREYKQINVVSEPVELQIHTVPAEDAPATFNGAIGSFDMNVSASPTDVAAGDPITVKVDITGRGQIDGLTLPDQPGLREFKTYSPNTKVDGTDPLGLAGTKHFDLVISPQNAGIKELPPLVFSFFDPEQKKYRTLTSSPIPLNVRPTAATPQPTVVSATAGQESAPQSKEIVHIKPQLGTVIAFSKPLIEQPWFLGLQAVPPLLWIGSIVYRRRKENLENNPRLRRQRAVENIVRGGLQQLRQHAAANESEAFFATVFRLLQEQIGERLDVPASGITEAVLEEFQAREMPSAALDLLRELFELCNQARYAPVRGSQQLTALVGKVEQGLAGLKGWNDHKPVAKMEVAK